uniref:Uncharacterized protein n=1 Tax=Meloidogyne incognita TaxID=6306 RepID=A0A914LK95_MELIC
MLIRCLLPMDLDTGPLAKKSSTLCSLLLLLTIAALAVPGQDNSEEVGFGKHTKDKNNTVTLADKTIVANNTYFNFTSCRFKELYPDACDISVGDKYIELRYNYGSKGCTVDLLSKNASNNSTIKFKAGVRGDAKGGLSDCLDETTLFRDTYNNTLPFVYSVNGTIIKELNNRKHRNFENCSKFGECKAFDGTCMQQTSLQVSWSKSEDKVYGHTYLIGEDQHQGLWQDKAGVNDNNVIFDLEISTSSGFIFNGKRFNASKEAVCVPKKDPIVEPKAWTIKDGEHRDKQLLVFSLLRQTSSVVYKGLRLTKDHPNGPRCELFVRFNTSDYSLLLVDRFATTTPPTTTTTAATTGAPTTGTSEPPGTTTSSLPTPPVTVDGFSSIRTTTRTTTKCSEQEECGGGLLAIGTAAAGLFVGIIIAVLVWFWMRDKAEKDKKKWKQDAERAEDKRLRALYEAEKKLKGKKALGTFDEWKKNRKESDETTAFEMGSVDDLCAVIWKKVEKDHAKAKMQFLVDQFEKHRDKEVYDREYEPEKTIKGYDAVGRYQDWKMRRNIYPFEVIDGTSTALEYGRGKKAYDKPYLPGAVDESIPETE